MGDSGREEEGGRGTVGGRGRAVGGRKQAAAPSRGHPPRHGSRRAATAGLVLDAFWEPDTRVKRVFLAVI